MHSACRTDFALRISTILTVISSVVSCGHTAAVQPGAKSEASPPGAAAPSGDTRTNRAERVPREVTEPPSTAKVGDVMTDHFLIVTWARDSVIVGLLEPLREPLNTLAAYRYEGMDVPAWSAQLAELQAAARLTASAQTLDVAAAGVATMGRICGDCHTQKHGGPTVAPPPKDLGHYYAKDFVPERMERHMIAADLLWEGLTGPSDATWKAGADALVNAPEQLDEELPVRFETDLREIRALGVKASEASTLSDRADAFGLLLATCADCHTRWIEDEVLH